MYRELLIGCGKDRIKRIGIDGDGGWQNLTTLDFNQSHQPDIVCDLEKLPLPIKDNSFDEIHAYEVLEHTGNQGDWKFFFNQFSDFWRICKPNGLMMITIPSYKSIWAYGDPSHKRVMPIENFMFLSQNEYEKQVGVTQLSDFRFFYKADFDIVKWFGDDITTRVVLKAVKYQGVFENDGKPNMALP